MAADRAGAPCRLQHPDHRYRRHHLHHRLLGAEEPECNPGLGQGTLLRHDVGFVLYLFLGQTYARGKMFRVKREADERVQALVRRSGSSSRRRSLLTREAAAPGRCGTCSCCSCATPARSSRPATTCTSSSTGKRSSSPCSPTSGPRPTSSTWSTTSGRTTGSARRCARR